MNPSQRRLLWLVLAGAIAALGLLPFLRKEPSELPVYVLGAERMLAGSEIYRTSDLKPFTYPPFFALPFAPLVPCSVPWQRALWYVVTLLALAYTLRHLARFVAPDLSGLLRARRLFWVIVLAVGGRHVLAIFENQSHDMLVLACTVAAAVAWAAGQQTRAGAFAGLGAACKATPGLFAVPFLLQASGRALLGASVVGAAATLLPDLVTPRADGRLWVVAWASTMLAGVRPGAVADLSGTWTAGSILNQSLSGTVYRLTTPLAGAPATAWEIDSALCALAPDMRRRCLLLVQGLVLAAVVWLCRRGAVRRAPGQNARYLRFGQAAAVACGMVLLSPMSSKSHFGVMLLPVALAALLWCRGWRDRWLTLLLLLMFVVGTLSTKGVVGSRLGNMLLAYGSVTWTAVLALLLVARAQSLLRRRPFPA